MSNHQIYTKLNINNEHHLEENKSSLTCCQECILFFQNICLLLTMILNIAFIVILIYVVYPNVYQDVHSNLYTILILIPVFSCFCVCSFVGTCVCTQCIHIDE